MEKFIILYVITLLYQLTLAANMTVGTLEDIAAAAGITNDNDNGNSNDNINSNNVGTPCDNEYMCLPKSQCPEDKKVEFGGSNVRPRIGQKTCLNEEVCCLAVQSCGPGFDCVPHNKCINNSTSPVKGQSEIKRRQDIIKECSHEETCCLVRKEVEGCGHRNLDGFGFKIAGGEEAEYGEFPWLVAILHQTSTTADYIGGGSIITPRVVVTAAHTVESRIANTLILRAGEWDSEMTNELYPHQDRNVGQIISHEHYNTDTLFFDIALLIIDTSFEFVANVQPICLPPKLTNFNNNRCIASGWGKDSTNGAYQPVVLKVELPIVSREKCQNDLRNTKLGSNFHLHSTFICAGGELGKDTCTGDGGSPLICPIPNTDNRYYQAGIVSWGLECGLQNVPSAYTNVAGFRDWIDKKLDDMSFEKSSFIFN